MLPRSFLKLGTCRNFSRDGKMCFESPRFCFQSYLNMTNLTNLPHQSIVKSKIAISHDSAPSRHFRLFPLLIRVFFFFCFFFFPGRPCKRCTKCPARHVSRTIFWVVYLTTGSATMSNESRAIGRASTSGMPWTISSLRDRRRRTAYAPSESIALIAIPRNARGIPSIKLPSSFNQYNRLHAEEFCASAKNTRALRPGDFSQTIRFAAARYVFRVRFAVCISTGPSRSSWPPRI